MHLTLTQQIIVAVIVIVFAIDGWLVKRFGVPATISYTLLQWSKEYPVLAFGIGFIMGHLFWENCGV
jgi:hypothetical protein